MKQPIILDNEVAFDENSEGLVIQTYQEIPDEFREANRRERFLNTQSRVKNEYHRVASIPTAVIEKWAKEGFDFWNEPAHKIVKRLANEHLDDFITSDKALLTARK